MEASATSVALKRARSHRALVRRALRSKTREFEGDFLVTLDDIKLLEELGDELLVMGDTVEMLSLPILAVPPAPRPGRG